MRVGAPRSRGLVGVGTRHRDHVAWHPQNRAAWHPAAGVPKLLANPEDDFADPCSHDAIIGQHAASATLALQPKLIVDDFLNHREFPEENEVAGFHVWGMQGSRSLAPILPHPARECTGVINHGGTPDSPCGFLRDR